MLVIRSLRRTALAGAGVAALASGVTAGAAWAADPEPAQPDQPSAVSEVVVTGTRIANTGFTAPTPVSVVTSQRLEQRVATNLGDVLNELPAFRATQTPANQGFTGGYVGGRVLDLRGLGPVRTLTLVDGKRFVPSTLQGTVDTNMIPSILVDRVEVVTGGASAAYGSDAVAGVVNFIMNKRLTGIRAHAEYGVSSHDDDQTWAWGLALGGDILGGKVHVVAGGEYENNRGVGTCIVRDWCAEEWLNFGRPPGNTTLPANNILPNIRPSTISPGGVINNTILRGIAFAGNGQPYHFQYGTLVNPLFMVGGEGQYRNGYFEGIPIKLPTERWTLYGHAESDLSDSIKAGVDLTYAQLVGDYRIAQYRNTAFPIQRDNAFIPSSPDPTLDVRGILDAHPEITSFNLGRHFADIGNPYIHSRNRVFRVVASLEGKLSDRWGWDAYYQFGRNDFRTDMTNAIVTPRLNKAIDAVRTPGGQIVCRVNVDPNPANDDPACVPVNIFGEQVSQAARNYIIAPAFQTNITTEHVVAANLRGDLVQLWAGPLSIATGGEFRSDKIAGTADPVSQALGFQANNGSNINGRVNVVEGYIEGAVPLAKDMMFARSLDLNGAVRRTHYSRNGAGTSSTVNVTTWKLGGVWEPFPQIRFRLTRSRDIRAPNVTELFGPLTQGFAILNDPAKGGLQTNPVSISGSNPNLVPEVADTWTYGVVLRPSWGALSRLQVSVDRFDIRIKEAIGSLGGQTIATRCFQGATEFCALITRDGTGTITEVRDVLLNVNELTAVGWDVEAAYNLPLGNYGDLDLRLLASYYEDLITRDSAGTVDRAGQTGLRGGTTPGIPRYTLDGLVNWKRDRLGVDLHMRYIPKGRYNPLFIGPDEPGYSIALGNSSNTNSVPAAFYADVAVQYDVLKEAGRTVTLYAAVNNIADRDPPRVPGTNGSGNNVQFDPVGRTYRFGLRFRQ